MTTNVLVKPNDQSQTCLSFGMARKRRMKSNVFVKPNDQSQTCLSFGMARPDERSMSRVEFTPTMPCKEEEDKVKTKDEIQHNVSKRYEDNDDARREH